MTEVIVTEYKIREQIAKIITEAAANPTWEVAIAAGDHVGSNYLFSDLATILIGNDYIELVLVDGSRALYRREQITAVYINVPIVAADNIWEETDGPEGMDASL